MTLLFALASAACFDPNTADTGEERSGGRDGNPPDSPGDPSSTTGGTDDTTGDGHAPDDPDAPSPVLPVPTAPCPGLQPGDVTFDVGGAQRSVRVWLDPARATDASGPILLYWYGTEGTPDRAASVLGSGLADLVAAGGVVVAPTHVNDGLFPWLGDEQANYQLADEVVACVVEQLGNAGRRIHAMGFSAGGLFATGLTYARSQYVASTAAISGGLTGVWQEEFNAPAAFILHGGTGDEVFGFDFERSSIEWRDDLLVRGSFTLLCNHGGGHSVPPGIGPVLARFLIDHPFGAPSPYARGLPGGVPAYCEAAGLTPSSPRVESPR